MRISNILRRTVAVLNEPVVLSSVNGKVATVTLNRPKALNALNTELVSSLGDILADFDAREDVKVIILTGAGRAFAAGADIKEMSSLTFDDVYRRQLFVGLEKVKAVRIPIIAAVNGFALGGGCELAMMCDIILASDKAKFGQPEISIGTIPGIGGTVRLTNAVGKYKSMLYNLAGEPFTAEEAEKAGLVSAVVPHDELMTKATDLATKIASRSRVVNSLLKESILNAGEVGTSPALAFEKRAFQSTFSLPAQKEGMGAFVEKRTPNFDAY